MPSKDWQDMTAEERSAWVRTLVSLDEISKHTGMEAKEVFWAITIKQMPSALVGGEWKFDRADVDAWAQGHGGLEKVRDEVRKARAEHRQAQQVPAKSASPEGGGPG